jgi:hypothetical protein
MGKLPSYFETVKKLYEAAVADGAPVEEVVPQEQIADSGSDVDPAAAQAQQEALPTEEQLPPEEEGEEGMMEEAPAEEGGDDMMGVPSASKTMEKQKSLKLFRKMNDLIEEANLISKMLDELNTNLLSTEVLVALRKYDDQNDELITKITDYLVNIFNGETYQACLYAYIVYRTEFVALLKAIKDILKLKDGIPTQESKKEYEKELRDEFEKNKQKEKN